MRYPVEKCHCLILGVLVLFAAATAAPQDNVENADTTAVSYADTVQIDINGRIHFPGDILILLIRSDRRYDVGYTDSIPDEDTVPSPVLLNDYYQVRDADGVTFFEYSISDSALLLYAAAEGAFEAEDYDAAIAFYRTMLEVEPEYHKALVWLGQCFSIKGMADSAIHYYELSIERNFIDCDAHWFLADMLWAKNDTSAALKEMTIAHVLNVNHPFIMEGLIEMREAAGRPWDDWSFRPKYTLSDSGHVTTINTEPRWSMYAMTKALWKYEPGYAEKMSGQPHVDSMFCFLEETEALSAWIMSNTDREDRADDTIATLARHALSNGYLDEFIYYERIAPDYPVIMMSLAPEFLQRIAEYADEYH